MTKRQLYFSYILLIPIIHAVAQVTTNYFPSGTVNPGFFRVLYMIVIILWYFTNYKIPHPVRDLFRIVLLFLLYNFIFVLINDGNLFQPLMSFTKLAIPLFTIFIGFAAVNNYSKLISLFRAYLIASIFFVLNYVIANIFGLGGSAYLEDSFNIGGAGVGTANEIALFIIILFAFYLLQGRKSKWRTLTLIIIASNVIIMLLSMRRGAFLTLGGGIIIYIFLNGINFKIAKISLIVFIVLLALTPLYWDTFIDRYEYRVESREGSLANYEIEGRYLELTRVPQSLSKENKWFTGTHNLNSAKYFGKRELHVGYMSILHGSGLIGSFLFLLIIYMLFRKRLYYKKTKFNDNRKALKILYTLYLSLLLALLLYLFSSRLHGFTLTISAFLMMGSLLRVPSYSTYLFKKSN